eukprot:218172_1
MADLFDYKTWAGSICMGLLALAVFVFACMAVDGTGVGLGSSGTGVGLGSSGTDIGLGSALPFTEANTLALPSGDQTSDVSGEDGHVVANASVPTNVRQQSIGTATVDEEFLEQPRSMNVRQQLAATAVGEELLSRTSGTAFEYEDGLGKSEEDKEPGNSSPALTVTEPNSTARPSGGQPSIEMIAPAPTNSRHSKLLDWYVRETSSELQIPAELITLISYYARLIPRPLPSVTVTFRRDKNAASDTIDVEM